MKLNLLLIFLATLLTFTLAAPTSCCPLIPSKSQKKATLSGVFTLAVRRPGSNTAPFPINLPLNPSMGFYFPLVLSAKTSKPANLAQFQLVNNQLAAEGGTALSTAPAKKGQSLLAKKQLYMAADSTAAPVAVEAVQCSGGSKEYVLRIRSNGPVPANPLADKVAKGGKLFIPGLPLPVGLGQVELVVVMGNSTATG